MYEYACTYTGAIALGIGLGGHTKELGWNCWYWFVIWKREKVYIYIVKKRDPWYVQCLKQWGGDFFIKTNKKLALDLLSHIILKVATAFYLPWGQSNDKNKWILNL